MELQGSPPWLQPLRILFSSLVCIFTIFFSFLFLLKKKHYFCKCDLCRSYLTSSWSNQFTNLCDWYTYLLQNSANSTIHIHVLNNIITANHRNVEYMLKTRFDNFPKGKPFSMILGDFLGNGIFNVDGEFWKFQKKMASLELNVNSVRSFAFEIVANEITHRLVPLLLVSAEKMGDCSIDLQDVFRRFTFDNICRFTFGLDPGCLKLSLPISEFAEAFDLASHLSAQRALQPSPCIWKIKRLFNIGTEKKLKDAIALINILAGEIIRQRRLIIENNHQDLLSRFVASIKDDKYLRDIIISFILAGRDSVAAALTSFFWLLAKNPNVETNIIQEADRVMGLSQHVASLEQLQEMTYLQAALYESMRLYPPVQFDSKFTQEDDILPDGTPVKKGTRVTYHPYAMGRMEEVWGSDCLEFKPERWLKNGTFSPISPYKYPVFQAGIRVCLGKDMALLEMKTVAVSLIRQFEIEPVEPHKVLKFVPGLTATLSGGHRVMVRKRGENNCWRKTGR